MSTKKKLIISILLAVLPVALGAALVATLATESGSADSAIVPFGVHSPEDLAEGSNQNAQLSAGVPVDVLFADQEISAPSIKIAGVSSLENAAMRSDSVVNGAGFSVPSEGVDSGLQIARLTDVGGPSTSRSQLYRRWAAARSIGTVGGAGAGRGSHGTGIAPSDSGENIREPSSDGQREPSGTTDDASRGSDDQESSSGFSEDADRESSENDGRDVNAGEGLPPAQEEEPVGKEEELVAHEPVQDEVGSPGQDPIANDPIYIPPTETSPPVVQVPEPETLGLLGMGLIGCFVARRKRSRALNSRPARATV